MYRKRTFWCRFHWSGISLLKVSGFCYHHFDGSCEIAEIANYQYNHVGRKRIKLQVFCCFFPLLLSRCSKSTECEKKCWKEAQSWQTKYLGNGYEFSIFTQALTSLRTIVSELLFTMATNMSSRGGWMCPCVCGGSLDISKYRLISAPTADNCTNTSNGLRVCANRFIWERFCFQTLKEDFCTPILWAH